MNLFSNLCDQTTVEVPGSRVPGGRTAVRKKSGPGYGCGQFRNPGPSWLGWVGERDSLAKTNILGMEVKRYLLDAKTKDLARKGSAFGQKNKHLQEGLQNNPETKVSQVEF